MRGDASRDAIRAEALRQFGTRGIDAVSVRDIASAVGMSAANLYAHFPSKEALVLTLFRDGYADYARRLLEAGDAAGPALSDRLPAMVRLICRLHDEDADRFRFLVTAQHPAMRAVARDRDNPVEIICRLVADAMAEGEIRRGRPSRDPVLLGLAVIGVVVQAATGHLYGRLAGGLLPRADELVELCRSVLR